jgi:hypothetical protein
MVNTYGPEGSVTYQADPNAPGGYSQNTALSPTEQQTYDLSKQAENGALNTANTQLGRVNDALGTPLSMEGLPSLHGGGQLSVGQGTQNSFDQGGPLQYGFNQGQQVQGQVGPQDLSAASQQAQDAAYGQATARLDPQFAQNRQAMETKLANQGLSQNSDAYRTALSNFDQQQNDAYSQARAAAVQQGNAAAQQLFDQSLAQGQFANQAAGQMYGQNLGAAQFNNQTAGQDYSQNLGAAQFNNAAQNQTYNQELARAQLANTARQQGLQERAYLQNMPINQFTSLLGLGQVGTPQGINYTPTQVGNTDVLGAYALNQQGQQFNAQAQAQANGGLMGGLMGLGSAAIMASDRRLKTDLRLIRRRRDGVGVYAYRYRGDPAERVGVMAQELKRVRPDLVVRRNGYLAVNYAALGEL